MNNFPIKERFHPKGATAQEYKELCNQAGKVQKGQSVNGWTAIDRSGDKSGFKGTAYEKNGKIVICYEGTNVKSAKDHKTNLEMGLGGPSKQMGSALGYYKTIEKANPNASIDVAGHSEGGSEATYVGLSTGSQTYTYNAYGLTKNSLSAAKQNGGANYDENLITNYRDPNDPISKMKANVGTTYIVPSTQNAIMTRTPFGWLPAHRIDNMGDCNEAIPLYEYKAKNPIFIDKLSEAHITTGDIIDMPNDIFSIYEDEIDKRVANYELTDDEDAKKMSMSGKLVFVQGYQREDGTKVRGYYRRIA